MVLRRIEAESEARARDGDRFRSLARFDPQELLAHAQHVAAAKIDVLARAHAQEDAGGSLAGIHQLRGPALGDADLRVRGRELRVGREVDSHPLRPTAMEGPLRWQVRPVRPPASTSTTRTAGPCGRGAPISGVSPSGPQGRLTAPS